MTYQDQFMNALEPHFKATNSKNQAAADSGLRLACSVMAVFKVFRDLSTTTKDLPDDFRKNTMIAMSEMAAVWPNDPIMNAYGGRFWHNVQLALADWMESPAHQVRAEETKDVDTTVRGRIRAVGLQETVYSVIMDIARFTGCVDDNDPEVGIKLREAVDKTMRE